MASLPILDSLQKHVDEIGHTERGQDIVAAMAVIRRLHDEKCRLTRIATDRAYMMKAYRDMLGPNGLEVAEMWDRKGVLRQHTDWGPEAHLMTGEDRAQALLDAQDVAGSLEPAFGPHGETRL